ncbi:MAG TPA: aldo/keto reductase, partial [Stellaceae bacterium]|nr:aldo/keto reductase [Stellaceae bacterium]
PSAFGPGRMGMRDYAQLGARATQAGMGAIALRVLDGGALLSDPASRLHALAQEAGIDLPTLALRYALSNESIATALVGFSDRRQIEAACEAARSGPLPTLIRTRINP